MAHPVTWFQIQGSNGDALSAFYKAAFNWKMSPAPGGGMMLVQGDEPGISGGVGASMNGQPSVTVYIECDDIDKHLRQIERLGGRTVMAKMELPANMGHIAGFVDPGSNWIGLWQPPKQAAKAAGARARTATKRPAAKKAAKRAAKKPAKKRR
jgi:predicted enzyme related to lactoylglutathione lyase